jgi:cytochrome c biogenesis protein CcdA
VNLALAIFFVVLGVLGTGVGLFLVLGWPGLMLLGGIGLTVTGLLAIPVDRGER